MMASLIQRAYTNKLHCVACNSKINNGDKIVVHYDALKGSFHSSYCTKCEDGKAELCSIEEDDILNDSVGLDQY